MPSPEYHAETETLSRSQFDIFCKSPRDYYETFITKRRSAKTSAATILGTICHAVLLENKAIGDICVAYPEWCFKRDRVTKRVTTNLNPKPASEFAEDAAPKIAVKQETINEAAAICGKMLTDEKIGPLFKAGFHFETRVDAVINDVPCRCSPDLHWLFIDGGRVTTYDLKFTMDIHPERWWLTAKNMRYAVQDAFYSLILEARYGVPSDFRFLVAEVPYPNRVEMRWYDDRSRELARQYVLNKLNEFHRRTKEQDWDDNWSNHGTVSSWELDANEDGDFDSYDEMIPFEG